MRTKKVNPEQVMQFVNAGVAEQAIANRFGITVEDVYDITMQERNLDKWDTKYKISFAKEWNEATALVLKGLKKANN